MARRRNIEPEVMRVIEAGIAARLTASAIHRSLLRDAHLHPMTPSLRTVSDVVAQSSREITPPENWTLAEDADPDAGVVLDTLARVIEFSRGRVRTFTKPEAMWIKKLFRAHQQLVELRQASPGDRPLRLEPLSGVHLFILASKYARQQERGLSLADLDRAIAFAPWVFDQDEDEWINQGRYEAAVANGWIEDEARLTGEDFDVLRVLNPDTDEVGQEQTGDRNGA